MMSGWLNFVMIFTLCLWGLGVIYFILHIRQPKKSRRRTEAPFGKL